jgi:hypothetical protein
VANITLGGLTALLGIVIGGLIVAYVEGWAWLTGVWAVAVIFAGLFISILVAVFLPIGNATVKGVAMMVVFTLIVLYGLSTIGVM